MYRSEPSSLFRFSFALAFVIIVFVKINFSEHFDNIQLFSLSNIFIKRRGDGFFLGPMMPNLLGFGNQTIVYGKIGRHEDDFTLFSVYKQV
jgi:hypothetical protein